MLRLCLDRLIYLILKSTRFNLLKSLNLLDISLMEQSTLSKLTILSWNTTYRCNLTCSHCYASSTSTRHVDELSTTEGINFIESLRTFSGLILVFSGGEPLCRPDIHTLIQAASDQGLRPVLGTNGTLLKDHADRLKEDGLKKAGVSLDSPIPRIHNTLRGSQKAFKLVCEGIRYCQEIGIPTQIHTTIGEHNISDLEEMIHLAENFGCDAIHFFFMVPTGRAIRLEMLSTVNYEHLLEKLYELQKSSSILVKPVCAPQYLRVFSQQLKKDGNEEIEKNFQSFGHFTRFKRGCIAGSSYARVNPFGEVTSCPYIDLVIDSIRNRPFLEIWQNSPILNQFRNGSLVKGKCSQCDYLNLCGGGCRARAYSMFKQLDAVAQRCMFMSSIT